MSWRNKTLSPTSAINLTESQLAQYSNNSSASSASSQRRPQIVNDYVFGPLLGIGTYGEVRSALNIKTGQQVALKLIDLQRFRPETACMVLKEVDILQKLNHPNCIKVIEVLHDVPIVGTFCTECACTCATPIPNSENCRSCAHTISNHNASPVKRSMLVIIQELAAGGELFALLLKTGPLPEHIARHFFNQLLDGIEHCHERGVIHRDIKPENLVFDSTFKLKIVDFGLASCVLDRPEGSIERQYAVLHSGVGSKPYSAPEVSYTKEMYNASGYKGKPADIWSCAVVLFVMLTGRPPFYRPLLKTFNTNLVRCRHFARIMRGSGYDGCSPLAKDLLTKLFKLNPDERLTIDQIRKQPWMVSTINGFNGAEYYQIRGEEAYAFATMADPGCNPSPIRSSVNLSPAFSVLRLIEDKIPRPLNPHVYQTSLSHNLTLNANYRDMLVWVQSKMIETWNSMERQDMVELYLQNRELILHLFIVENNIPGARILNDFYKSPHAKEPPKIDEYAPSPVNMYIENIPHAHLPPIQPNRSPAAMAQMHNNYQNMHNMAVQSSPAFQPYAGRNQHPIPVHGMNDDVLTPLPTTSNMGVVDHRMMAGTPLATPALHPLSPNMSVLTPGMGATPSPATLSIPAHYYPPTLELPSNNVPTNTMYNNPQGHSFLQGNGAPPQYPHTMTSSIFNKRLPIHQSPAHSPMDYRNPFHSTPMQQPQPLQPAQYQTIGYGTTNKSNDVKNEDVKSQQQPQQ